MFQIHEQLEMRNYQVLDSGLFAHNLIMIVSFKRDAFFFFGIANGCGSKTCAKSTFLNSVFYKL